MFRDFIRGLVSPAEGFTTIQGKHLVALLDYLKVEGPFKGKKINVIEELKILGEPVIVPNGLKLEMKIETDPVLVTIKYMEDKENYILRDEIDLYSITLMSDIFGEEILCFRCTPGSIQGIMYYESDLVK